MEKWTLQRNGVARIIRFGLAWSSYLNEHHWVLESTVFKEKEVGLLCYGNS